MTTSLLVWLIGGGIVALGMMLFVVILSRGIEQRRGRDSAAPGIKAAPGMKASQKGGAAKAAAAAALLTAINPGLGVIARAAAARRARNAAVPARKRIGLAVGGASVTIFIALVTAIARDRGDNKEPPVPVELTSGALHGTLLSPRNKAPVVLIVPGSGPTDRDGNNPLGVGANSYKLLAEALAHKGIASVRVDKRGMFGSAGAGDANAVSIAAYAQDYGQWIDTIRGVRNVKCVWLLGHSEGALMVSAAAEGRKDVCGLILVAGTGRKLGDVLRGQLRANPANAPILDQAFAAIADLEAGRHTDTTNMHPALVQLFAPQVQDYLISLMSADPVEVLRRANKRTLIIQGTTDLQVGVEDARLLDAAPRTKLRLINGMNHVLKIAPEDRAANIATYSDPSLPLAPRLAKVIEDFIEDD